MNNYAMEAFPLSIDTKAWKAGHIQGIAVDPVKQYIYYSYTTILVKARLDGTIVGWVGGLLGHLGCIDFNDEDGKVYGSLEYKHDVIGNSIAKQLGVTLAEEDAFYISIFDVDRIDRPEMDAEKDGIMKAVYLPQVVEWYHGKDREGKANPFTVSGIDGLGIGPVFGEKPDSPSRLMLCSGIYNDPSNTEKTDYHAIMQYDWREFEAIAAPLSQLKPHHQGLYAEAFYFLNVGNTTWGIQNLEYDALDQSWLVCVYKGKAENSPNLPIYVINGAEKPVPRSSPFGIDHPHPVLKKEGIYHEATDIWGLNFNKGQTGVYAFGNGYYYFSYPFSTEDKKNSSIIRLCTKREDPETPFLPVEEAK